MAYILLYQTGIDYFTATSFETEFYRFWLQKLTMIATATKPKKIMQYDGRKFIIKGGEGFIGTGTQKGMENHMLRLEGTIADENKERLYAQHRQGFVNVSRIDIQITVPHPSGWEQFKLLADMHEKGRIVGWRESVDRSNGGSQTVYVGARESNRFVRVYVKHTHGDEKLLRLEVEYKKRRANAVTKMLRDGELPDGFLRHELQTTLKHEGLNNLFSDHLYGENPANVRLKINSSLEKTEKWLINQVLPSFKRAINDHDASGHVLDVFGDVIQKYLDDCDELR